jgi:hypothetical protein
MKAITPEESKAGKIVYTEAELKDVARLTLNLMLASRSRAKSIEYETLKTLVGERDDLVQSIISEYREAGWVVTQGGGLGHFPGQSDRPVVLIFGYSQ